jgi:hypothetical protein
MNDNNNPNKTEGDLAENDLDQSTNQGVGRPSYRIEEVGTDGGEEKGQQEDSLGKQSIEQGVGHQQTPVNSTKVTGESPTEPQTPPANPMASVLRPEMQEVITCYNGCFTWADCNIDGVGSGSWQ